MYPINAASPQRIAIGAVVQISDGAVQTTGVSVKVMPQGGAAGAGGGTTGYEEGIVHYIPTQAETNYASFMVIAYKTGCIPVAVTVVTTASATAGHAAVDWGVVANKTTTNALTGTTIATTQKVDVETIKTQTVTCAAGVTVLASVGTAATSTAQTGDAYARLGAPAGASVSADLAAIKAETAAIVDDTGTSGVVVAAASKSGYSLTATTGLGNQTADITGSLSGSVGSVTGSVGGNVTGSVGSVAAGGITASSIAADAIGASELAADAVAEIAAAVLTTQMTEAYRADGAAPTLAQGICETLAHLGESSISTTTKTIKKFDGTTTAATFTLDDATTPTSITRAT